MPSPFAHLHVHTHYSLLDGANRIPDLVKQAKKLGMDSLAITDHGCMFGVVEFFNECKKEGIKPILGMEAYMAPGDRREKSGTPGETAYHLLLLAENIEGYHNLLKLSSTAYREGFYYKPRIDKEVLREFSKGLIATSACLGGEIPSAFMRRGKMAEAKQVAETYLEIFGPDRFFIEVQNHVKEQNEVNPELAELAKKTGIGLVATNDVHFLTADDHKVHDVLCCISMGKLLTDDSRLIYPKELYLKSPDEMKAALGNYDQAIENTARIAAMCDLNLDFSKRYAPVYPVPAEKLDDAIIPPGLPAATLKPPAPGEVVPEMKPDERYLRQLCETGLIWRYGTRDVEKPIRDRLDYEISVIASKNFCSYFLINWDFCNFARDNGIPVGARGSGVGCMVAFLLGLCNVDPLKYGLLFERFMDPSRNEMPDIDIDICQDGRQRVIEYVRNKYGHVAQIITFGTLAAKAACKDVGRVLGVPLPEIEKLTKLIPGTPGMTLKRAMDSVPELSELVKTSPLIAQVMGYAQKLEGMCRNAGCHAAGVIIADQPLDGIVPLYRDSEGNILTQFEGPIAEKCGLLKMDFLGLRTLTTLTRSLDLEKQTRDTRPVKWSANQTPPPLDEHGRIDIEKIDLADTNVFGTFQRGESKGIFQFESGGMQDLLMKMVPDRIEDLIAANALYRPGPMELIPTYCNRKHGREQVPQVHPIMDSILAETYGIMVYQEQVMQIFNQLGGIELSNAYKLIKAISKKNTEIIGKFKPDFIKGTMDKGVPKEKAEEIFDFILKFGGYGFNKSHSTRYAIIAYQTAYMKTYHPVEYMSAVLTFEMGSTEKVVEYIEECRRMTLADGTKGIGVLPPDVNVSDKDFTPVYTSEHKPQGKGKRKAKPVVEGVIRFGLAAVRGVGEKAVEAISEQRKAGGNYTNLYDFCERIDLRAVGRSTIEALVKCGAFNSMGAKRSQLMQIVDRAVEMGQQTQNDKRSGQMNMFGGGPAATAPTAGQTIGSALPDVEEFENADLLKFEKELLGFYITSHPLTDQQTAIERYTTASSKEAMAMSEGTEVTIGGMIARVKKVVTKNGRSAGMPMGIITLEDLDGQIDGTMFAETFAEITTKYPTAVAAEQIVFVKGKIDRKRETPSLLINEVIPLADAVTRLTTAVCIKLDPARHNAAIIADLPPLLGKHKGTMPIYFQVSTATGKAMLQVDRQHAIKPSPALVEDVEQLLGSDSVDLAGAGSKRRKRLEQARLFKDEADDALPAAVADVVAGPDLEPELDAE
jgi:DNA polymerase-3 subunit alpha